ncbi:MAG: DUF2804 domain-containing protein [Nitriliruptoraceae bacterium]
MTTHERELTAPVDLCAPDGRRLNPAARGWARRQVHRANLRGSWGRTKRWDYHAILTDDLAVSLVYADVDYLGIVGVWWAHLGSGRSGGREVTVPLARGIALPERYGTAPLTFRHHHLGVEVLDDGDGTRLVARWRERDGRLGRLDATVLAPPDHESLDVVIPWSERRFQYTSKHQARPVVGTFAVGDERATLGVDGQDAWGVLDIGRGRWPYRTRWCWGSGTGRSTDGHLVGIQVGGRWTDGTGATENGSIVDGEVTKIGTELVWAERWEDPMAPWHVAAPDGTLDLTLTPRFDRHARTELVLLGTEVHQVFGRWSGHLPGPDGTRIEVDGLLGFAEESRSRW